MKCRPILFLASLLLLPVCLPAQTLDPEAFHRPPTDTWPTYNGDYSGRRYSTLSQINASNVKSLGLAWTHHVDFGCESYAQQASEGRRIKSTPLLVDGVLYFTITDNVWAMDALTGRELWHYAWPNNRAIHVANRGVGMYGSWLYFMSPDNYLVSLNAKDGTERWRVQVADVKQDFFSATSPLDHWQPRHCRSGQQRQHSRMAGVARSGNRRTAVEVVGGSGSGCAGLGDLGRQRHHGEGGRLSLVNRALMTRN